MSTHSNVSRHLQNKHLLFEKKRRVLIGHALSLVTSKRIVVCWIHASVEVATLAARGPQVSSWAWYVECKSIDVRWLHWLQGSEAHDLGRSAGGRGLKNCRHPVSRHVGCEPGDLNASFLEEASCRECVSSVKLLPPQLQVLRKEKQSMEVMARMAKVRMGILC